MKPRKWGSSVTLKTELEYFVHPLLLSLFALNVQPALLVKFKVSLMKELANHKL